MCLNLTTGAENYSTRCTPSALGECISKEVLILGLFKTVSYYRSQDRFFLKQFILKTLHPEGELTRKTAV